MTNSNCANKYWPEILMSHHTQINQEILMFRNMLHQADSCVITLDSMLKKITKAIKMHLQLEANFLAPFLDQSAITSNHRIRLNEGFESLNQATFKVLSASRSMVNDYDHLTRPEHLVRVIEQYLNEIEMRLSDEDLVYAINIEGNANV